MTTQYAYTAKSNDGETLTGVVTAEHPEQVRKELRDQSLFVVSVKPAAGGLGRKTTARQTSRSRVSKRELLMLTTQLSIMTRAGIDLAGALKTLSDQSSNPTLKATLKAVHTDVTSGKPVSESLRPHAHIFGEAYISSMAAGEASGSLAEVLNRLTQLLRSDLRNRGMLRTLLAYPVLLASVSTLVTLGLIFFVLPRFAEIFDQYELELPMITQVLIGISTELRSRLWLWATLIVAGTAGLVSFLRSDVGRRRWDSLVLNLVIVRDVTRSLLIGRAFRLLGIMIESGVPLLDALRLTRASIQNVLYRELFETLEEDILNGRGLGVSLVGAGFVPAAAAEMVLTAERTGSLGMVTQLMGEHYEEEGETKLRELVTMLEPLIIIVMGVIVALVVMSVMLPMFDLSTLAK